MPLGKSGTLSEQEAWDVAAFMNSHERPQDPRFTKSVVKTRKITKTPMTRCTAKPSTDMCLEALEMVAFSCLANTRN